jgi:hypothetical protein
VVLSHRLLVACRFTKLMAPRDFIIILALLGLILHLLQLVPGGDFTGTFPNPGLVTSGVSAGSYGSSTSVPTLTVDAKGRINNCSKYHNLWCSTQGVVLVVIFQVVILAP